MILLADTAHLPGLFLASALFGLSEGVVLVGYLTLRAEATPDHLLGRVGATSDTVVRGLMALGVLTAGFFLDLVGGRVTLGGIGLLALLQSLGLFLLSALREVRSGVA